jgi:hypothetical protein
MSEPLQVSAFTGNSQTLGIKVAAVKGVLVPLAVLSGLILSRLGLPASFSDWPILGGGLLCRHQSPGHSIQPVHLPSGSIASPNQRGNHWAVLGTVRGSAIESAKR